MCRTYVFTCMMLTMTSNFTIFFIISIFFFKFFIASPANFCFFDMISVVHLSVASFLSLWTQFFHCMPSKDLQNFFTQSLPLHISFYTIKYPCCRQWLTTWNMFTYFYDSFFFYDFSIRLLISSSIKDLHKY